MTQQWHEVYLRLHYLRNLSSFLRKSKKSLRTPWGLPEDSLGLLEDSLRNHENPCGESLTSPWGLLEDCWRTAGGLLEESWGVRGVLEESLRICGECNIHLFCDVHHLPCPTFNCTLPTLTLVPDLSCEWVGKGYSFLWVIYLLNLLVYHPQPCHFQYMLLSMPPLTTLTTASSTSLSPAWLCCFGDNHAVDASWDDALFTGVPLFVWKDHHQHSLVPDFIGKTSFPHFDQLFGGIGRWNFSMFPFLNDHSMYS